MWIKNYIILGLILIPYLAYAQEQAQEEISNKDLPIWALNHHFEGLNPNAVLDTSIISRGYDFQSLGACLAFLEAFDDNPLVNEIVYLRLQEIAERFYDMNTPVLVLENGAGSWEGAVKANNEDTRNGIIFTSMGNSCLSFGSMNKGIQAFNRQTQELLNNRK
ncbi:MAG: hypothetical protein KDD99_15015 [Bacteroidetes bacterium]|nr:hypothetical protein [Bacteroidota bacterium]